MAMVRLFCLYAILIFAKRAPKLITDLLNIKSENIGLKGLNIKNKMGEAALVGDKVKSGMTKAEGAIRGGAAGLASGAATQMKMGMGKGFVDNFKKTMANSEANGEGKFRGAVKGFGSGLLGGVKGGFNKDTLKKAGESARKGAISGTLGGAKAAANAKDGNLKGIGKNAAREVEQVTREGNLSVKDRIRLGIRGGIENIASRGISSLDIARSNDAVAGRDKYNKLIGSWQTNDITDVINKLTGADQFNDDASHVGYMKTQKSIADTTDGSYTVYRVKRDAETGKPILKDNGEFDFDEIKFNSGGVCDTSGVPNELLPLIQELQNEGKTRIVFTSDYGADKLLLKKNIYEEREKVLSQMQQRYSELVANENTANAETELRAIFDKHPGLFSANAGNSEELELNIPKISFGDIMGSGTPEFSKYIASNGKGKSANDSEISKRDEIEQRKAAGQATTDDGKK